MRVVVIIPALNEERTVGAVVKTALACDLVSEVVVVSDGSVDATVSKAAEAGARVIDLAENLGKGGAMQAGLADVVADVVLFLDADLLGLTPNHVSDLLLPVVNGSAQISLGLFGNGRITTDLAQKIAPFLSGQRAMHISLLSVLPDFSDTGWGVEVALSKYVRDHDIPIAEVHLRDVSQVTKEEKIGLVKGLTSRLKMYWQIIRTFGRMVNDDHDAR
jgi:glycosyltransferase involved in cell wall biosynthesis